MKALLTAIKAALAAAAVPGGTLAYIDDDTGLWVTPDEDIVPMSATFPAIGIKDGPVNRIVHTNIQWEVHMLVHVVVYVQLTSGDTPVISGTSPVVRGVLEIAEDIETVLSENYLSITGMEQAFCLDEDEGQVIGDKDFLLYKKPLHYQYIKQETRP
jgi:hypothetical protein